MTQATIVFGIAGMLGLVFGLYYPIPFTFCGGVYFTLMAIRCYQPNKTNL